MRALTNRERDVLALVARHYCDTEIAESLVIAVPTVRTHVGHILQKIGVENRRLAARLYLEAPP